MQYQRDERPKITSSQHLGALKSLSTISLSTITSKKRDRRFYLSASLMFAVIVFAGFARTYYLRSLFTDRPLTALLHIHGLVFTSWLALLVAQITLVQVGRTDIHRRLGIGGGVLALVMIVLGPIVAVQAARRNISVGMSALSELMFLAIPLGDILVFSILGASGFLYRRKPEVHKRLLLLATIAILPPAIARLPLAFIHDTGPLGYFGVADLVLLSCIAYDVATRRRVHPAYMCGGVVILASQPLRLAVSRTHAWLLFARWITS